MCLGVPMRVVECDGFAARAKRKASSARSAFSCFSTNTIAPGDHLMVHIGQAIRKMTEAEARSTWELFDEVFARESRQGGLLPSE